MFKWRQGLGVVAVLLLVLLSIVFLPAIKEVRTVEIKPENEGILFTAETELANEVIVPTSDLTSFGLWIYEGYGVDKIKESDYESIELEIRTDDGQLVRTVVKPRLIKRSDKATLLFSFKRLRVDKSSRFEFVIKQTGNGRVRVQQPMIEHVKEGEIITTAFQLGEKKSQFFLLMSKIYEQNLVGRDISFYLHRGKQIVNGQNPYSCVVDEGESCVGYPSHLPGMYLVAAGAMALGADELSEWAKVWRPIMIAAWLGVGLVLLVYLWRQGQPFLAVAVFGFWLFNRWSIEVLRIAHTDFVGVLFLLLAVTLVNRWPKGAALLLGMSLAIKQIAILIVPLFLIYVWRKQRLNWLRLAMISGLVLLVPLLVSAPFLFDDANATVRGWLNVAERQAQSVHGFAPSLVEWLDVTGNSKLVLMLFLTGVIYLAAWWKTVDLVGGTLMILIIMMSFTPVLYNQYFVWLLPFIPLAVTGWSRKKVSY